MVKRNPMQGPQNKTFQMKHHDRDTLRTDRGENAVSTKRRHPGCDTLQVLVENLNVRGEGLFKRVPTKIVDVFIETRQRPSSAAARVGAEITSPTSFVARRSRRSQTIFISLCAKTQAMEEPFNYAALTQNQDQQF